MNIKAISIFIISLIGFTVQLDAQFNPEARAFLDDALEKLQGDEIIELEYSVNQIVQNEMEELSVGNVFMKGDLYKVISDEFLVIYDGTDQWIYRPDDEELMIQAPDSASVDESNPVNMLKSYKTGYKFDLKEETDSFVVINMVAQDPFSPYILVTVKLNKVKKEFVSLTMLMRDENALKINLTYKNSEERLDADLFNFNALGLPVIETVDLREN